MAPLAAPLVGAGEAAKPRRAWQQISVPGHWQLEDAFSRYSGLVLYRCRFTADSPSEDELVSLRFGGVYYSARVWLNGAYLGDHEGYFAPFEFDITDAILRGDNGLLVEVYSPEEAEENDRKTIGGVWARWDGIGPGINPGGVYRDVEMVSSAGVRIRSLEAEADHMGCGRAHLRVYARRARTVDVVGRARPVGFDAPGADFRREVRVEPGENRIRLDFYLPQVSLWWTWDRGEQPLYGLTIGCGEEEEETRFGARSVELRDWKTYLNGERVFLRGINYVPTDAYPARSTDERLRADARLVRETGMNAVRVHAHVAEEGFYDACDDLGLLVLQDFPLQWTHRRRIIGTAVAQAAEMAGMLRSHPSVAVYLAHDEPFYVVPPEKWSVRDLLRTAVEVLLPRWALWQRRVLDPAVVRSIEEEDCSRPVIDAAGHLLTTNHLYFGWYYGKFRDLERAIKVLPGLSRLPTEYGAQALPDEESLQEIWPEGAPPDWHALTHDYRLQVRRMVRYVPWKGDRARFIRESQRYQAEVLQHATELFRRRKYRPTGGTFAFMLNDAAPAITWSIVDWRRRPKAAYEVLANAMSPILLCSEFPKEGYEPGSRLSLPLFLVNDYARELGPLSWSWELSVGGLEVARGLGETDAAADSVTRIGHVVATVQKPGLATLRLALVGDGIEANNAYGFRVGRLRLTGGT